jgi:hypothetical protein
MSPKLLSNTNACDSEAFSKGSLRPFSCIPQSQKFGPLRICQFTTSILFPTQDRLRMQPHPVPIASCHALRMQPCGMLISTQHTLRMDEIALSAFTDHILHVVRMRAKEEAYLVVDASPDIAAMEDKQSLRGPCTRFEEPANDVSAHVPFFVGCGTKIAVPVRMRCPCPQPTGTLRAMSWRLVNFGPEASGKHRQRVASAGSMITRGRTVLPGFGLVRQDRKRFRAEFVGTDKRDISRQMTSLLGRRGKQLGSSEQGRELAGAGRPHLTNTRV